MRHSRAFRNLGRRTVHIGDAEIAIERAESVWNVFQRFPGKLLSLVDFVRKRRLLFMRLLAQRRHLQLRFDAGNQLAGRERLGQIIVGAGLEAVDASPLRQPVRRA